MTFRPRDAVIGIAALITFGATTGLQDPLIIPLAAVTGFSIGVWLSRRGYTQRLAQRLRLRDLPRPGANRGQPEHLP